MGMLDWIREWNDPGALPVGEYSDPQLGKLTWSDDDEAWQGTYGEWTILLGYERSFEVPTKEVIEYACSVLFDTEWVEKTLSLAKRSYVEDHPSHRSEVESLTIKSLHFNHTGKTNCMMWSLGETVPERFWYAEFSEREMLGTLGYDT